MPARRARTPQHLQRQAKLSGGIQPYGADTLDQETALTTRVDDIPRRATQPGRVRHPTSFAGQHAVDARWAK